MNYNRYYNVNAFLDKALDYIEKDEATNNLMLGVCFRLQEGGSYSELEPFFSTIENENGIVLAAVMTPPNPLILYGENYDDNALEILAEKLMKANINLSRVIGEKTISRRFAQVWAEKNNIGFKLNMNLRVYFLDKVNEVENVRGYLRIAKEEDKALIAKWIYNFDRDANTGEPDMEKAIKMAETKIKDGEIYLWEDNVPVAMAASSRKTKNGIVISLVYTPKELRGRGYASACVAELSKELLDRGNKFCALFTDLSNPTSNSIYMKIGYKPISDFDNYSFIENSGE
jgi:predicted GNAT family acetyltransferase